MKQSSIACDSAWISTISSNLCHFNWFSSLKTQRSHKGLGWALCPDLAGPSKQKLGFVSGCHSANGAQILQKFTSCFNLQVKCISMYHIDRPGMLQILLIVCCLSSRMILCIFSELSTVCLDDGSSEGSRPSNKVQPLLKQEYHSEVCVILWHYHQRPF